MRVVLDTNVLVSGLLKPSSACGKILELFFSDAFLLCLDARILLEYYEVLHRPKFDFEPDQIDILLKTIEEIAFWLPIKPITLTLLDEDDRPFMEVAAGAQAHYIVTGNRKHFPESIGNTKIWEPSQFIELW